MNRINRITQREGDFVFVLFLLLKTTKINDDFGVLDLFTDRVLFTSHYD